MSQMVQSLSLHGHGQRVVKNKLLKWKNGLVGNVYEAVLFQRLKAIFIQTMFATSIVLLELIKNHLIILVKIVIVHAMDVTS